MILVTVGSIHFDSLVREVDTAVGDGRIREEVLIQIGNGMYEPRNCAFFRTAPGLGPYYQRADLVVGHGGTGTTLEILERGLRLVSVSNPQMVDNHQHEFLEALEGMGLLKYCRDVAEVEVAVNEYLRAEAPQPVDVGVFFGRISKDLESWPVRSPDGSGSTGWKWVLNMFPAVPRVDDEIDHPR